LVKRDTLDREIVKTERKQANQQQPPPVTHIEKPEIIENSSLR